MQISAGLLMCRLKPNLEFFLVHPGGPYFKKKEEGAWTIPKGLVEEGEDLLLAAQREFKEETGITPQSPFHFLGIVKMKSGKIIHAWAFIGEWNDGEGITSNTFPLEWPPKSGKTIMVPEIDKASWFDFDKAMYMIHSSQKDFLWKARDYYQSKLNL